MASRTAAGGLKAASTLELGRVSKEMRQPRHSIVWCFSVSSPICPTGNAQEGHITSHRMVSKPALVARKKVRSVASRSS